MRARTILIAVIIAALPVGFMYRTLVMGRPLARDDASVMVYPFFHALDQNLADGRLYLWESAQWCGLPAMARSEVGALYPPHLLLARLLPWLSALHMSYWLHLVLGGAGVFWVARNLGASPGGAIIGATAFAFSGYQCAHLIHFAHIVGVAYVPLMLGTLQTALRSNSGRWWALFAVISAFGFAGGHPQIFLMALTVCLLWLIFGHDWHRDQAPAYTRLLPLLLTTLVGVMLVAPQLLPLMDLATATGSVGDGDATVQAQRVASFSFRARDLVRVLLPSFYGTVHENILGSGPAWHETNPFTGAAPLLLGIAGAIVAFRRGAGWGFCIATFVIGAILMPAEGNPIHVALARVPVLGGFRAWGRWMVLPILSLSLLSALAVTYLPEATRKLRAGASRTVAILSGLIIVITAILWLVFGVDEQGRLWLPGQGGDFPLEVAADAMLNCLTSIEPILLVAATVATLLAVLRLAEGEPRNPLIAPVLVLAIIAPQWYLWQQTNLTVPRAHYTDPPATVSAARVGRIATIAADLLVPDWSVPGDTYVERAMNTRELLPPALGTIWGIWYADGYPNGLITPSTHRFGENWFHYGAQAFSGVADVSPRTIAVYGTPAERMKRLHQLSYVHHIVTAGTIDDPDLKLTHEGIANVYSYAEPPPRWWLAREAIVLTDPEAQLDAIKRRDFDPERQVVLDREVALGTDPDAEMGIVYPVEGNVLDFTLSVVCPEPRVLVLADAWYPGWSVTVGGEPAELLRANYAFRGVVVPAGAHNVTFSFRPATWGTALPMFAVGLLVVLALALWPKREPPRKGLKPPAGVEGD